MWTAARARAFAVQTLCPAAPTRLLKFAVSFVAPLPPGVELELRATRVGAVAGAHRVRVEALTLDGPVLRAEALVAPCLDRICESLSEVVDLKWQISNRFCNPSMAQILPSQDVVLSVYFQATGDFLIGDLRLVIPFGALEPLLDQFGRDPVSQMEPGAMRQSLGETVNGMPVDLSVNLGGSRIRLGQLLNLQEGDVIPLETRFGEPAVVPVMGKPKFTAQLGRIGNRLGARIADVTGDKAQP